MTPKKILFTGAAGRVGQLLRPLLRARYAVRLCDLNDVGPLEPGEEFLQGNLADPAFAREAVAGTTGVVHLAGLVSPAVSFEDTLDPNYRAVLSLLEACRALSVKRFVFASSHHIVGLHRPGPLTEQATVLPDGFYGLSKAFGEAACALYAQRFGIGSLVIRIGNADPRMSDGRRERMWISGRDLTQLIGIGLEHEPLDYEIVYGVSQCPDAIFPNEVATRLGYRPEDRAADHHAPNFRPMSALTPADGSDRVGGFFAEKELPPPDIRT